MNNKKYNKLTAEQVCDKMGIIQIVFHNPGNNKVVSVEYKNSGTSFPYGNYIWKWKATLCAYYGSN